MLHTIESNTPVTIYVGENGTGKSRQLNKIAKNCSDTTTLCICNTAYSKFKKHNNNCKILNICKLNSLTSTIKNIFLDEDMDINMRIEKLISLMRYAGYSDVGFKITGISHHNIYDHETARLINKELRENTDFGLGAIEYMFEDNYNKQISLYSKGTTEIIWLSEIYNYNYTRINSARQLFAAEKTLKKYNIIRNTEIILRKEDAYIQLRDASSGETLQLASAAFITKHIENNTTILIDEPESSLHIKWQKEYVKSIVDQFYQYNIKLYIATHSPFIISGACEAGIKPTIIHTQNGRPHTITRSPSSIEKILAEIFDTITPSSELLHNTIVDLINRLSGRLISLDEFEKSANKLKSMTYSEKQHTTLDAIINLGNEIEKANKK